MPKLAADQAHADDTTAQLHDNEGLQHLRARKYGATLLIESGPTTDPVRHARLLRDTPTLWILEIADHRGRWGQTGMRAPRSDLVNVLVQEFGWVLTDVTDGNPERNSDP